jgi:hypothetical protein
VGGGGVPAAVGKGTWNALSFLLRFSDNGALHPQSRSATSITLRRVPALDALAKSLRARRRFLVMPKIYSDKPIFVDLFYGVVVGSAVASLSLAESDRLPMQVVWVLAVLEDWYLYYRHIADPEGKGVVYSFRSLLTEFLILLAWFLGFQALKESGQQSWFFVFFALFYGLKVLAGVTFYFKHGQLFSRRMAYDAIWVVLIAASWFVSGHGQDFTCQFWVLAGITTPVLVLWWLLTTFWPPPPPPTPTKTL